MCFWRVRFRALRAPAASALRRGQGLPPPFHARLSPLAALCLRCAPDKSLLTKLNTSQHNRKPASLRSDGVRDHPGMPFGFPLERAFSFTGITKWHGTELCVRKVIVKPSERGKAPLAEQDSRWRFLLGLRGVALLGGG
jgi:hypothetical protein